MDIADIDAGIRSAKAKLAVAHREHDSQGIALASRDLDCLMAQKYRAKADAIEDKYGLTRPVGVIHP